MGFRILNRITETISCWNGQVFETPKGPLYSTWGRDVSEDLKKIVATIWRIDTLDFSEPLEFSKQIYLAFNVTAYRTSRVVIFSCFSSFIDVRFQFDHGKDRILFRYIFSNIYKYIYMSLSRELNSLNAHQLTPLNFHVLKNSYFIYI